MGGSGENQNGKQQQQQQALPFESPGTDGVAGAAAREVTAAGDANEERNKPEVAVPGRWTAYS